MQITFNREFYTWELETWQDKTDAWTFKLWLKLFMPFDYSVSCSKPPCYDKSSLCNLKTVSVNTIPAEKVGHIWWHQMLNELFVLFCFCDQQESLYLTCVMTWQTNICRLVISCFCPTCAMFAKSFYQLLGCVCSVGVRTLAELTSKHTQQEVKCMHSLAHWAQRWVASWKSLFPGKTKLLLLYFIDLNTENWLKTVFSVCQASVGPVAAGGSGSLRNDSCQTTWPLSLGQPTSISSGLTCMRTAALSGDVSIA